MSLAPAPIKLTCGIKGFPVLFASGEGREPSKTQRRPPVAPFFCENLASPWSGKKEIFFEVLFIMRTGTVKWFDEAKGFGFIAPEDGSSDVFVHYSVIEGKGFRTLGENQKVEFEVKVGPKGPQATMVKKFAAAEAK